MLNLKKLLTMLLTTTSANPSSYESNWEAYGSDQVPTFTKVGRVVMFTGAFKPKAAVTIGTTVVKVATIPVGYRPTKTILVRCQGSNLMTFTGRFQANGSVTVERLTTPTSGSYQTAQAGYWFPITATWIL